MPLVEVMELAWDTFLLPQGVEVAPPLVDSLKWPLQVPKYLPTLPRDKQSSPNQAALDVRYQRFRAAS